MSDEKRALTRHSAPPSEADYEAILAAVVETGRGRWFLHEFAQRNRHAETRGVLSAIERLEGMLHVQGSVGQDIPAWPGARQIATAIARAREMVGADPDDDAGGFDVVVQSLEAAQVRLRAAYNRLQDTAKALREDGGQTRLCNDLDRQIRELDAGCAQLDDAAGDIRILASVLREIEGKVDQPDAAASAPAPRAEAAPEPALVVTQVAVPPPPQNDPAETGILVSDTVSLDELEACIAEMQEQEPETAADSEPVSIHTMSRDAISGDALAIESVTIDTLLSVDAQSAPVDTTSTDAMTFVQPSIDSLTADPAIQIQPQTASSPQTVTDPADFLLEPLPHTETDADTHAPQSLVPADEPEPAPARAFSLDTPDKTPGAMQLDSFDPLAPLRVLSDEEKIALFS
jgi:chemotaxis protein CheZ